MAQVDNEVNKRFQDLVLDLNLDQVTAEEAWKNYETLKLRYVMEVSILLPYFIFVIMC